MLPPKNYDTIFAISVYKTKDYRQNYNINLSFVYGGSKPPPYDEFEFIPINPNLSPALL